MSIIVDGNSGLCPELATPSTIITKENVDALKLSTYNRTHGTTVIVSCLAAPEYHLVGPDVLTCLSSNQWDKTRPHCRAGESISGGGSDITMVPMLVAAGTVGVLVLAVICIMTFVLCCWTKARPPKHVRGSPIGLFRSLSQHEAESVFSPRRHRYYSASECSDVMDSVSARGASHNVPHTPDMGSRYPMSDTVSRSSPTTYITAVSRGTELPYRTRYGDVYARPFSDTTSRSSPTATYVTALSKGTEPPLKIQVTTGRPYRTWHELFYNSYT
ncbi:uncharacterized protein LOC143277884 [Babylonia areolata]|uniref:uncharacterized protein LOC143277884 n=1 Tax=Babylonia areolata TaxID=304850 RepID=UPI003FD18756